jgi:hypothetical protein
MASAGRDVGGRFTAGNIIGQGGIGIAVGFLDFLEGEESKVGKYFRSIEFGTQGFVGRSLRIIFDRGSEAGLDGLGAREATSYLRSVAPGRGNAVVRREITAMDAYGRAFAAFDPAVKEKALLEQQLGHLLKGSGIKQLKSAVSQSFVGRAQGQGFLTASATLRYSGGFANLRGDFRSLMRDVNVSLAEALAAEVAAEIRQSLKRPGTSTGRLEEAALDSKNRLPN